MKSTFQLYSIMSVPIRKKKKSSKGFSDFCPVSCHNQIIGDDFLRSAEINHVLEQIKDTYIPHLSSYLDNLVWAQNSWKFLASSIVDNTDSPTSSSKISSYGFNSNIPHTYNPAMELAHRSDLCKRSMYHRNRSEILPSQSASWHISYATPKYKFEDTSQNYSL